MLGLWDRAWDRSTRPLTCDECAIGQTQASEGAVTDAFDEEKVGTMRNTRLMVTVLVAMFALGGALATVASAETTLLAEWLINGTSVATLTLAEGQIEYLYTDTSNGRHIVCSKIFVGSVGPNGEIEATEELDLPRNPKSLSAPTLCTADAVCESSTTDVEMSPEELPWHGLLYLSESTGVFLEMMLKTGYSIACLVLGIKVVDECSTTDAADEVVNVTGGVEEVERAQEPLGTCSIGGAGTDEVVSLKGNLTSTAAGTLTVSE